MVPPPTPVRWQHFQERSIMYLPQHFRQADPALLLEATERLGCWQ
jgi:hypothetical protein